MISCSYLLACERQRRLAIRVTEAKALETALKDAKDGAVKDRSRYQKEVSLFYRRCLLKVWPS